MSFLSERRKAGMTQVEVSRAMGVDQSAVSFWETGVHIPRGEKLVRLAELYGCTVDDLLKEEKKK